MNTIRWLCITMLVCLLLALVVITQAQDADVIPEVVIIASEEGIELPEAISAGLTTITFQNDTEAPFSPIIARLNEGKTMEDFMTGMQEPSPAAALATVSLIGGLETAPESSLSVTYDLLAGDYLMLNFTQAGPPDIQPFTIAESDAEPLEAPEADVVVALVDFAFTVPTELEAGVQTWQIQNDGEQWHEMAVFRIEDDMSMEEVTAALMEAMMASEGGPPEMPFESALFWSPMSADMSAWVEVDLEPGTYAILCFLPDLLAEEGAEPMSHLQHGMISLLTVSE